MGAEGREGTKAGAHTVDSLWHLCCPGTQIPPRVESSARKRAGAPCMACTRRCVDMGHLFLMRNLMKSSALNTEHLQTFVALEFS